MPASFSSRKLCTAPQVGAESQGHAAQRKDLESKEVGKKRLLPLSPVIPTTGLFPPLSETATFPARAALHRVAVGNVPRGVEERELRSILEEFGPVASITFLQAPYGGSFGENVLVDFATRDAAHMALTCGGSSGCRGRTFRMRMHVSADKGTSASEARNSLYFSNISPGVEQKDIEGIFGCLGRLRKCVFFPGKRDACQWGYGYAEYFHSENCQRAIASLRGSLLGGRAINTCGAQNDSEAKHGK